MPSPADEAQLSTLNRQLVWDAFKQMTPVSSFVLVFGAAFGLAATQHGVSGTMAVAMSAMVFAGAAQFATLDLWGTSIPVVPLALTVLAINSRHLLMGATLYPYLCHHPPAKRYGLMLLASDVNWATAMQRFGRGEPGLGVVLGGGLSLWVFWVGGTWLGAVAGAGVSNPKQFGLDMVMGCFILAIALGGPKNRRLIVLWIVAAVGSLLAYWYLPPNSHVIAGAVAGGLVNAFWPQAAADATHQATWERTDAA